MRAKAQRLTVLCPFCRVSYTFKSEESRNRWIDSGANKPLHSACKAQALKVWWNPRKVKS